MGPGFMGGIYQAQCNSFPVAHLLGGHPGVSGSRESCGNTHSGTALTPSLSSREGTILPLPYTAQSAEPVLGGSWEWDPKPFGFWQ